MGIIKKTNLPFRVTPARFAFASLACSALFLAVTFTAHSRLSSREKGRQLRRRVDFYPYPATTVSPHRLAELLAPVNDSVEEIMMHEASAATTHVTQVAGHPAQDDGSGDLLDYLGSTVEVEDDRNVILNKQTIVDASVAASDYEYPMDDSNDRAKITRSEGNANDLRTLREKFHVRSLEVKQFFRNLLHEAFPSGTEPSPRYSMQHPQDLYSQTDGNDRSCGQLDAFAGVPIHDGVGSRPWIPPIGSAPESVKKWDAFYRIAMRKIKDVPVGNSKLQDIAEVEVEDLRAIRHNLFCGEN